MQLIDIITPARVATNLDGGSKKRVLELASEFIASESGLDASMVYQGLIERERLGSTGIGYGVAIPHCRLTEMAQTDAKGYLMQLRQGIDFDAIDQQPVELLFILLVPQTTNQLHLNLLAHLADCFSDDQFRHQLQLATTADELFETAHTMFSKERD
ncbi:MAG: PTS sugar transporter subunit IIA [Gammaproteobacteria bacterium]|nr:PTS sugar transporter subunit IIA [Gammaproteobacteria bacterium]